MAFEIAARLFESLAMTWKCVFCNCEELSDKAISAFSPTPLSLVISFEKTIEFQKKRKISSYHNIQIPLEFSVINIRQSLSPCEILSGKTAEETKDSGYPYNCGIRPLEKSDFSNEYSYQGYLGVG